MGVPILVFSLFLSTSPSLAGTFPARSAAVQKLIHFSNKGNLNQARGSFAQKVSVVEFNCIKKGDATSVSTRKKVFWREEVPDQIIRRIVQKIADRGLETTGAPISFGVPGDQETDTCPERFQIIVSTQSDLIEELRIEGQAKDVTMPESEKLSSLAPKSKPKIAVKVGATIPGCIVRGDPRLWKLEYCAIRLGTDDFLEAEQSKCFRKTKVNTCADLKEIKAYWCAHRKSGRSSSGSTARCIKNAAILPNFGGH